MGTLRFHAPQILPCKLEYPYLWVPYAPRAADPAV